MGNKNEANIIITHTLIFLYNNLDFSICHFRPYKLIKQDIKVQMGSTCLDKIGYSSDKRQYEDMISILRQLHWVPIQEQICMSSMCCY